MGTDQAMIQRKLSFRDRYRLMEKEASIGASGECCNGEGSEMLNRDKVNASGAFSRTDGALEILL